MPSIGAHSFRLLSGQHDEFGETVEDVSPANVDGASFRARGEKSVPFSLVSMVDLTTAALTDAEFVAYKNIQGTVINIEDQIAITHNNYMVIAVTKVTIRKAVNILGGLNVAAGDDGYILVCRWLLQAAGVPS